MPHLLSSVLFLARIASFAVLAISGLWAEAKQVDTNGAPSPPLIIEGLGKGTTNLSGPWQFHVGDNPAWSSPSFDSSSWEQLSADRPWGKQNHARLTGIAWYRCNITLTPAPGVPPQFSLLMPQIDDAYEVYWNGALIGRNGRLQPLPVWYFSQPAQIFALGRTSHGVLAVRVWKAPLFSDDSGDRGGFEHAPLIGSPAAIAIARDADDLQWLRGLQFQISENLVCLLIALLSLLLWWRNPAHRLLLWMAVFALVPPASFLLLEAHLRWPYTLTMGADQPLVTLRDISLWFLLLCLLPLHENRTLVRITRILACICLFNGALDGLLIAMSWNPRWISGIQAADALSTILITLLEIYPLVLVGYAIFQRRSLNASRWLVAILVLLDEMMLVIRDGLKQGRQFTGWSISSNIDAPLFTVYGSAISLNTLAGTLLLIAVVYAVYSRVREDQMRQEKLEREKLEWMRENERMRHHAEHDGLTGLWNHRIIVDRLREEMNRSQREGTPLSVVLADVDYFKKINDSYGHTAGDMVLKEISTILMHSLRPYDWVGRYGGEEFLIILPGCEMDSALERAEQLRLAVQSARIPYDKATLQVTASFGVVSNELFDYGNEIETVIQTVDTALYRAKSNGRNCIVPAEVNVQLCE